AGMAQLLGRRLREILPGMSRRCDVGAVRSTPDIGSHLRPTAKDRPAIPSVPPRVRPARSSPDSAVPALTPLELSSAVHRNQDGLLSHETPVPPPVEAVDS